MITTTGRELYSDEQELIETLEDAITEIKERRPYLLSLTLTNIARLGAHLLATYAAEDAADQMGA